MQKEIKNFYDLESWQKGHEFLLSIYRLAKDFPKEELYGLTSQIKRAAISVTNNIAEGFSRYHYREKSNFYYNARGSVSEVQNLLIVARDVGYLKKEDWHKLDLSGESVKRMINGLIRSVDKQLDKN